MTALELAAALGAVQGTLLLVLILLRYRRVENVPLALLLLVFSLRLATIPTWNPATMNANPWLLPLTTPLPFLFGPLLWWFARELRNDSGVRTTPRVVLHFAPYLLDLAFTSLLVAGLAPGEYCEMIARIFAGDPPMHLVLRNGAKVAINVVYVGLAIRVAFRRAPAAVTTVHQRMWLRWLVLTPLASLALFAVVALRPDASAQLAGGVGRPFTLLAVAMAVLIYVFSLLMLTAPEIPARPRHHRASADRRDAVAPELQATYQRFDRLLGDGGMRDPDLNLDSCARRLGVHPNHLSHAINAVAGQSFPAAVNRRRVDYFVERAAAGDLERRTILDLAFDAGFSSKSTFNRAFRALRGVSPSQYRRSLPDREGRSCR